MTKHLSSSQIVASDDWSEFPAIAAATGTLIRESDGATPTGGTGAPVSDFAGHSAAITAAQGYVSNPAQWNAPSPTQVAHLLSLCGISHGVIAANPAQRIKYICPDCGGDNIIKDATAVWDADTQQWVLNGTLDFTNCAECEWESDHGAAIVSHIGREG